MAGRRAVGIRLSRALSRATESRLSSASRASVGESWLACSSLCKVCAWLGKHAASLAESWLRACAMACAKRAAALPVGAANKVRKGCAALACSNRNSFTTVVVLPVPGPPVMRVTA